MRRQIGPDSLRGRSDRISFAVYFVGVVVQMTTIAYRDGVIAGDSMMSVQKVLDTSGCKKVFRLSNGAVIGFAGAVSEWDSFLSQMEDAISKDAKVSALPAIKGCKNTTALMSDGVYIYQWERGWEKPHKRSFAAIGHGMFYAIAAMKAGASAKRAIKIASEMSPWTGGRIQTLEVQ